MSVEAAALESLAELLGGYDDQNSSMDGTDYLRDLIMNHSYRNTSSDMGTHMLKTDKTFRNSVLIIAYSLLCVISIFGNSLVCYVICKNKRLHTATNYFIANLAVADLLVTCVNVPFNIARNILDEWPFGDFICHLVNFSLMVSVYVSTYTLTAIALDRHRVVLKPFTPRMSKTVSAVILVFIWLLAIMLSLPYGIFNRVKTVRLFITSVRRCRSEYPDPNILFKQYLTVITFCLQYVGPLTLIGLAYGRIVRKLWVRTHVGAVTHMQQISQARAKKKSIKLLVTVVVVFAICWLPLNLYHLLTNLHPNVIVFQYNSTVFFICHWIAICSTCFNPFIYCWLNETFREELFDKLRWCLKRSFKIHPGTLFEGKLVRQNRIRFRSRRFTTRSSLGSFGRSLSTKKDTMSMDVNDIPLDTKRILIQKWTSNINTDTSEINELIPKFNGSIIISDTNASTSSQSVDDNFSY
ncbi:G-protein coupled receptor 83 [Patella vulgata]|uniref:G-protein coupled receptor 83 n=1 Tax=Patella vulgata TaxID=6465 RepID=UPI0021806C62|nr:G-protein coupled receptor 83 [Patella vulgata]